MTDLLALAEQTHQKAQGSTDCPFWMQVEAALREAHAWEKSAEVWEENANVERSMRKKCEAERDEAREANRDWLLQNGPGGWINDLRVEVERLRALLREARKVVPSCGWPELLARIDAELGDRHE